MQDWGEAGCAIGAVAALAVILGAPAYFVWDGYVPRELPEQQLERLGQSTAEIKDTGSVGAEIQPIPGDGSLAFVLAFRNRSDYIIRAVVIGAILKDQSGAVVGSFAGDCLAGGSASLRIPVDAEDGQSCIVPLAPTASDAARRKPPPELYWHFASVRGHHRPLRVLTIIADFVGGLLERVNR